MPLIPANPVADWGVLVTEVDVDQAVIATIKHWLPTYITQVERERDFTLHEIARPTAQGYMNTLEGDEFPDPRLPAIIVTTARSDGAPSPDGDRSYHATWRVMVSSIVRGGTPGDTRYLAALFGGCVRRVLAHQPLIEFDGEIRWLGGPGVAPVADVSGQGRFLAAHIGEYAVLADEVLSGTGPSEADQPYEPPDPDTTPDQEYDPPVTVTSVQTTVEGLPVDNQETP